MLIPCSSHAPLMIFSCSPRNIVASTGDTEGILRGLGGDSEGTRRGSRTVLIVKLWGVKNWRTALDMKHRTYSRVWYGMVPYHTVHRITLTKPFPYPFCHDEMPCIFYGMNIREAYRPNTTFSPLKDQYRKTLHVQTNIIMITSLRRLVTSLQIGCERDGTIIPRQSNPPCIMISLHHKQSTVQREAVRRFHWTDMLATTPRQRRRLPTFFQVRSKRHATPRVCSRLIYMRCVSWVRPLIVFSCGSKSCLLNVSLTKILVEENGNDNQSFGLSSNRYVMVWQGLIPLYDRETKTEVRNGFFTHEKKPFLVSGRARTLKKESGSGKSNRNWRNSDGTIPYHTID